MLTIILFCIALMYTPGPVNLLSLNNGLQSRSAAQAPFALGVAAALCFWFLVVGYAGSSIVNPAMLPWLGILGCGFIVWLAVKVLRSKIDLDAGRRPSSMTFRDGLFMQLLNPKAFMVVLPVTTVQFPAAGVTGPGIALWSAGLALLAFGAPTSYALLGSMLGRRIERPVYFRVFNTVMGLLLLAVAADIAWEHVIVPLSR